ncbi:S-layer homology domain-containing protein [Cohnella sp.]|uniref:S-layer homology domain-containing protein n=1 Tax=Cohnella sp. TaxID=1883426 RepID=UPI0035620E2E
MTSRWMQSFKSRWRRTGKFGLTLLLTASLFTSSIEQLAMAQERPEEDGMASFAEWIGQLSGELQGEEVASIDNVVYGDEGNFSVTDAVYGLPVKISAAVGGAPGSGDSKSASVSGDGRYVAFASTGSNLVAGDTNGRQDVFLHDRQLGTTKRISFGAGGVQSNGDSYAPHVSFDGSYVLFTSKATNLVSGDTNNHEDLFLYDAVTDSVQRIASFVSGSEFAGAGSSYGVSADGRYVAYAGKPASSGTHDIWRLDRRTGTVKRVAQQTYIYETFRSRVSISADGRYIAFDSIGTKIVPDDTRTTIGSNDRAVYLYDAALDEMKMISRSPTGQRGNHYSYYPIISADGRYVAYLSKANNIVPADTQQVQDVYVYDRVNGTTELASLNGQGQQVPVDAYDPSISADGRYIAFHTDGAFDPADGGRTDVYVRDRITGVTRWVSKTAGGGNADQPADRAVLSADGATVVFETSATNMTETAESDAVRDLYAVALPTDAAAPEWPGGASVTAAPGGTYIALSWPAVPGAAWYKISIDGRVAGITASTSFAADGLAPGTAHRYRVAAGTPGYVWSEWTAESTATTLAARETTPPSAAGVTAAPELGGALVSWTYPPEPDVVGAKVRWRKPGGAVYESPLYPRSVVSAPVTNLENGSFYEFSVVIVDGDGNRGEGAWMQSRLPNGPAIVRIDVQRETGQPAPGHSPSIVDVSDDGRYTLFLTNMIGLVPEDDRQQYDAYSSTTQLYMYDAERGAVMLVSRSDDGKLGNSNSNFGTISGDGRYIAFGSRASNLLANTPDTNGKWDVFLLDRDVNDNGVYDEPGDTSLTRLTVPVRSEGQDGDSSDPVISADGSTIVFSTNARNIVQSPPSGTGYYAATYDTRSRAMAPLYMPDGQSPRIAGSGTDLSANGKVMMFETFTDLADGDKNGSSDVYWYDRRNPEQPRLVWISGLIQGSYVSASSPYMDASGRHVVFNATFRINTTLTNRTLVFDSEAPAGTAPVPLIEIPAGSPMTLDSMAPYGLSDDGRYVLFGSSGKHIVPGDTDSISNLFLWDRMTQQASQVSVPYDPALPITAGSDLGLLSGDATRAAFRSTMMNMVRGSERIESGLYLQRISLSEAVLADLVLSAQGTEIGLEWGDPAPGSDVDAFRVVRKQGNGQWETLADNVSAATRAYTDRTAQPGMTYTYAVHRLFSGTASPFSVEKTITIAGGLGSFSYTTPLYFREYAGQKEKIALRLTGEPGVDSESVAVLLEYTDSDGVQRSKRVNLTEDNTAPGVYTGELEVPELAAELLSLKGTLKTADGSVLEKEALRKPIPVGATAIVEVAGNAAPEDGQLTIRSASAFANQTAVLGGRSTIEFRGLPPANDYTFVLIGAGGVDLLSENPERPPSLDVRPGDRRTVQVTPMLPASLTLSFTNERGSFGGVHVVVSDESGRTIAAGTTLQNGWLTFAPFRQMTGRQAKIVATPSDPVYAPVELILELRGGSQNESIRIPLRTDAAIAGTVVDPEGKPVRGATVQVSSRGSNFQTVTNENGEYSLSVPAGDAQLQVSIEGGFSGGWVRLITESGQTLRHDFRFNKPVPAVIKLNLYTEDVSGAWIGPYELDWREFVHFHIHTTGHRAGGYHPLLVYAAVGDKVNVCANGAEGGYDSGCVEVVIDDDRRVETELRLQRLRSNVDGSLTETPALLTVYKLDNSGSRQYAASATVSDSRFSIDLPGKGLYELRAQYARSGVTVIRTFELNDNDEIDLGELGLEPAGAFARREGNYALLGTSNAVPGTTVTVRIGYRNWGSVQAGSAAVRLDAPAGTTLVPGSVVWNGQPASPTEKNGGYTLDLGNVPVQGAGTIQYSLLLPSEWSGGHLDVSPRMAFTRGGAQVEEEIGFARAAVAQVTLVAPERTAYREFRVTGTAPAGSRVVVYAGDLVVGAAETTSAGRWGIKAAMNGETTNRWQLRAVASLGAKSWSSEPRTVDYDENHVEPISFTMQQTDGRKIVLDPRESVPRFPYVFAPTLPFVMTVKFNHPDRVRDVAFYLGDARVEASLKDGVHTAVVSGTAKPGPIGIDYRTQEAPTGWNGRVPPSAEIRAALPPAFRDATTSNLTVSQRSPDGSRQSMTYEGKLPGAEGDVDMKVTASLERTTYTPTAADLALAEETGVPVYGLNLSPSFNNGVLRIEMTGYLQESALQGGLNVGEAMALLAAGADAQTTAALKSSGTVDKGAEVRALSSGIGAIATRVVVFFGKEQGTNTWKTIDSAWTVYDGRGSGDVLSRLEGLMDYVALNCDPRLQDVYHHHIHFLKNHLIAVELTKAAIMVAGAVAGPATFGIGTVALFLVSNMTGKLLDAQLQGMIDELEADIMNEDRYCKKPAPKPKRKIADPEWIYDPSGYVYEVSEDNRIEGVRATALRWNEEAERWDVWNSEWYGQDNPLYTDADGRYAWDVPEGKWKVRYEKEGYLPAESEELIVLPPHFDVNIPLMSTLPAKPVRVEAAPGGAYVDILFDRHVDGDAVSGRLLAVIDNEGDVPGTWAVAGSVTDGDSKRVRFTPDAPLANGAYRIYVDGGLTSYAGVPLVEPYEETFEVTDEGTGPAGVLDLQAEADSGSALLTWKLPGDTEPNRLVVAYRKSGSSGEHALVELSDVRTFALLEGLEANTNYEVEVRSYDIHDRFGEASTTFGTAGVQPASRDFVPPGSVIAVAATPAASSIGIAWTDPTDNDLANVVIRWTKQGDTTASAPISVPKGAGRHTINGLAPSTAYEIAIWTVDNAGNASPPQTLNATTKAGSGPGNPGGAGHPGNTGNPGNSGHPGSADTERADIGTVAGELKFFDGAFKLWLPAGAAGPAKQVAATRHGDAPTPASGHLRLLSEAYEWKLEPEGGRLTAAGKLTIAYSEDMLRGADIRKLGIYRQDEADRTKWIYVGGIVDGTNRTATVETEEPGVYAVLLSEITFGDLANHWSRVDVEALAARGIASGDPDGSFRPNGRITRAEFVKLLMPLLGADAAVGAAAEFGDVAPNAWYAPFVSRAAEAGIVQGAGGRFRPGDPVTREEMAVMLFRALRVDPAIKLNAQAVLDGMADADRVSGWALLQIAYAVQNGLLQGGSGGKLRPEATATRAEAAVIVLRALTAQGLIVTNSK